MKHVCKLCRVMYPEVSMTHVKSYGWICSDCNDFEARLKNVDGGGGKHVEDDYEIDVEEDDYEIEDNGVAKDIQDLLNELEAMQNGIPKPSDGDGEDGEGGPEPAKSEPLTQDEQDAKLADDYFKAVMQVRKFCDESHNAGQQVDHISMRPIVYGKAALKVGIKPDALLYSMSMHWSKETRTKAGIKDYDMGKDFQDLVKPGQHKLMGTIIKLAEARIPIMAIGGSGMGKSYLAKQLATHFELPYGECGMTAGASPSWLFGSWNREGYTSRPFIDIYRGGGVFNFEEIDASDPNMLLAVNNALANDEIFNPVNGESVKKHKDFIAFSTANTFGIGAGRYYTGRERLDFATIDRFRMGRVYFEIDDKLESRIFYDS